MNDGNFETHLSMALIYPKYRFCCVNEHERHLPPTRILWCQTAELSDLHLSVQNNFCCAGKLSVWLISKHGGVWEQ